MRSKKKSKAVDIAAVVFFALFLMHVYAGGETVETEYPSLSLELSTLIEENEDVTGAIYIPALQLCYPVVWKEYDNTWYIEHDIEGNESSYGCIMIDGWNTPDLTDSMTLVYGHNMADGSMFGSLKRFLYDETLAQQQPYIYYYKHGWDEQIHTYRYQICSYYVTDIYDRTYYQPEIYILYHGDTWNDFSEETREVLTTLQNEWYDGFAYDMKMRAVHELSTPDLSERPHLLILSTCHGEVHGDTRLVVVCARG